jgi:polar amino acid transport system substrate-binding protein
MMQITQKLKIGKIEILEVPAPAIGKGQVLVRNFYSCVSPGTESSTVVAARKGYIGKAKERPEQVKQVIEKLQSQGFLQTYRAVMKKLDAHSPLGYSCVGQVVDLSGDVKSLAIGDFVACGGGGACHAELVSVSENLCVRIPRETDLKQAAYNTLGAIAMQGVRQADVRLGEVCAVIGLGVLGQLTCALLKTAGVKVVGIDLNQSMVAMAKEHSADHAFRRDCIGIDSAVLELSNGMGCDAVIITAASDSVDPINFAGAIARKRGTIVVVGAVPTGFDREPHFYRKELSIKMSCSYGPGRYDPVYEEKNRDYPYAYVRWTEKRNMQAFQDLLASRKMDVGYLTTHVFPLEQAPKAYEMILEKSEPFAGILIEYSAAAEISKSKISVKTANISKRAGSGACIGFIGAGSYAQGQLLPNIPRTKSVTLKGVMTTTPTSSRSVADRFGFEFCTSQPADIIESDEIDTIFIATRHDTHGSYVIDSLKAGKNVFVEKPLCVRFEELLQIQEIMNQRASTAMSIGLLMVGYNRRFSSLAGFLKEKTSSIPSPMAMTYRVNAGAIPSDSWIQDPEVGGGRLIGEVCHFIDFLTFLNGALPVSVYAQVMKEALGNEDTLSISICYQNGSIGTIHYFANGSKALPKEYIEVYQSGSVFILNDFKELTLYCKNKSTKKKLFSQDKGQKSEVDSFIEAVCAGQSSPIAFDEIYSTAVVAFKAIESLRINRPIDI